MTHLLEDFKDFLDSSPTSWHAASQITTRLAMRDFEPLELGSKWNLEKGKKYFIQKGGFVAAFVTPSVTLERALLVASHTDSPALKIKPNGEVTKENMQLLTTEVYGGALINSWLNRDLGIAGRVITKDIKGVVHEKLVFFDDSPLVIPQLAIHLDREGSAINKQTHLCALGALIKEEGGTLLDQLLKRHLPYHTLISHDLMLVPLETARYLGPSSEFLAAYRLDNLASVHASLSGLASMSHPHKSTLMMGVFFDHEEIGSRTDEGAFSPLLSEILERIFISFGLSKEEGFQCKHKSLCLSVDMAHAMNPNYPEKLDGNHQPLLGKGIALKYNAEKRYSTNAKTAAMLIEFLNKTRLPYQNFVMRSDMPCGSTVGPILSQTLGIDVVDLGIPQLSMHSIREMMATSDYITLYQLLSYFYQQAPEVSNG